MGYFPRFLTHLKRIERESKANQELMAKLANVEISIEVEVGEEDKMFGSVTNLDIHKALTEKDFQIERQSILLDEPIKTLGVHSVSVKLSSGDKQEIKVYVIKA